MISFAFDGGGINQWVSFKALGNRELINARAGGNPNKYTYLIKDILDLEILVKGESYIRVRGAEDCIKMHQLC